MTIRKTKAEETKRTLLEVAYKIVRKEGIHALSSTKIIKTAGISQGGFFHHFPQIEDLYLYMLDQMMQQMETALPPVKFKTFRQFVRNATAYTIDLVNQAPENITTLFYFLSQCRHKPDYQKRMQVMLNSTFSMWADKISPYFDPPLSKNQKDHIVRILDMYFCGFSFHYLIMNDEKRYRKISDDFADMILYSTKRKTS